MASHSVDLEALADAVTAMRTVTTFCDELRDDVTAIASELGADWTGEAAAQFLALQQEWDAGAQQMKEGMSHIAGNADASHRNYSAVQVANLRMWMS